MDKRFLAILTAIILIFVGIFIFNKNSNDQKTDSGSTTSSVQATNHVKGDNAKNVTLTVWGDYECAACFGWEPVIKQVFEANSANMQLQFRNLPLVGVHKNAFAAARAAEAADLQNKFWEMHDLLYESGNWNSWTTTTAPRSLFESYAQSLSLDMTKFKSDYQSKYVNDLINADLTEYEKTKQQSSTPTFFLNGQFVELSKLTDETNRPTVAKFQALLDAEFAKSQ
ncbi:hypothetical protein A3F65_03525 [Candidatus Saccharibacteria bacterium RIFCSPHIGHO2_12_FULL_47_16b]|nr:MAG: hypothetical protein A3F65_03525 [Candidatus Saccharibacteria bacterium RIFCSPHIGHO2_12_FULL_47_16b]